MTDTSKKPNIYLTETIIGIHNDVQSAVDYISEVAAKKGTELGKSSALMGIERIRLKLPINLIVDTKTKKVEELPEKMTLQDIQKNLISRKGFLIDRGEPGKMGVFTKMRIVTSPEPVTRETGTTEEAVKWETGEIELTFVPLKRE